MKFASMKVSRQLALGFGAVLALLTALLAVGISRMGQINDGLDMVINNRMPKLEKMYEISVRMMDNARIMRGLQGLMRLSPTHPLSDRLPDPRWRGRPRKHVQRRGGHCVGVQLRVQRLVPS